MLRKRVNWTTAGGALFAACVTIALAGPALADSCRWYGATALRQQQENERLKCGFSGTEWHSNAAEHEVWCATVGPDQWKVAAQNRDRMLAECAAKSK
ncbi:MAG: hypothetical protein NW217_11395 [Hyphomicrobiaceae bacterium]|nr:hypothetical protein [Hyphomicrobiaceae bacterium]